MLPLHHDASDASSPLADAAVPSDAAAADDASLGADAKPEDGAADDGAVDAGGTCGAPVTYNAQCDECLSSECCAEFMRCSANRECPALLDCISKCGFDFVTCPQGCAATHAAGVDDFNRANACSTRRCTAKCRFQDGGTD